MKHHIKTLVLSLGLLSVFSSCIPRQSSTTEGGHLGVLWNVPAENGAVKQERVLSDALLIFQPPGAKIKICASHYADVLTSALRQWARSIGRDGRLSFLPCETSEPVDHSIELTVYEKEGNGQARFDTNPQLIELFKPQIDRYGDHASNFVKAVILHEAGHLWGLCDMYVIEGKRLSTCDPDQEFPTNENDPVMGVTYPWKQQLFNDDITAMVELSHRWDVPANWEWAKTDFDGDGVLLKHDRCPYTRSGRRVNTLAADPRIAGCAGGEIPLPYRPRPDADKDGIEDKIDLCPNTPPGARVNLPLAVPAYSGCAKGERPDRAFPHFIPEWRR